MNFNVNKKKINLPLAWLVRYKIWNNGSNGKANIQAFIEMVGKPLFNTSGIRCIFKRKEKGSLAVY